MSTILNSSDDNTHLNQNTFSTITSNHLIVNEHQQIDSNLTKKFLTGHRGKEIDEYNLFMSRKLTRKQISNDSLHDYHQTF